MEPLTSIRLNISGSLTMLKKEWNAVRQIWKDSKAKEYEKTYLTPIVLKHRTISQDIETLERIANKLKSLGVDI